MNSSSYFFHSVKKIQRPQLNYECWYLTTTKWTIRGKWQVEQVFREEGKRGHCQSVWQGVRSLWSMRQQCSQHLLARTHDDSPSGKWELSQSCLIILLKGWLLCSLTSRTTLLVKVGFKNSWSSNYLIPSANKKKMIKSNRYIN